MEYQTWLGIGLLVCLILVSVPFERRYSKMISYQAQTPSARFFAGIVLILLASQDPMLGALAFLVLFLWVADIQLLSSIRL